jgi:hypothetical protein
MTARELLDRRRRPEVAGEGDQIAAGFGLERRDRPVDIGRRTAVDDHAGSLTRKVRGDRCADPCGAAGHQRPFAFEFEVRADSFGSPMR